MPAAKGILPKEITEAFQEKNQKRLESNAEYQRRKGMTREAKARDAKERVTRNIYTQMQRDGSNGSYSDAERQAEKIVGRYIREVEK